MSDKKRRSELEYELQWCRDKIAELNTQHSRWGEAHVKMQEAKIEGLESDARGMQRTIAEFRKMRGGRIAELEQERDKLREAAQAVVDGAKPYVNSEPDLDELWDDINTLAKALGVKE